MGNILRRKQRPSQITADGEEFPMGYEHGQSPLQDFLHSLLTFSSTGILVFIQESQMFKAGSDPRSYLAHPHFTEETTNTYVFFAGNVQSL